MSPGKIISDIRFSLIFQKLMDIEGGYVNDPNDPGGETHYGISKTYHPDVDIKKLTLQEAMEIYRNEYWLRPGFDKITNIQLAEKVFIFGVNPGVKKAGVNLQLAANVLGGCLEVDGIVGPKTIAFVNSYRHQMALVAAFKAICNKWYIDRGKQRYIAGWLKRLEV